MRCKVVSAFAAAAWATNPAAAAVMHSVDSTPSIPDTRLSFMSIRSRFRSVVDRAASARH
jgi:hypothetical protein